MDNVSFDLHPTFERAEADTLLRFYHRLYARNRFAAQVTTSGSLVFCTFFNSATHLALNSEIKTVFTRAE